MKTCAAVSEKNPGCFRSRADIQAGKMLVIKISRGSSMENIQIIQGYTVFLDRNIMAKHPPVTPRG